MKRSLIIASIAVLVLAAPSASYAGKKNKNPAPTTNPVMAKYDKNSNGTLEDTEKEAIRAALATDPALKPFDKNSDGKLDDAELADLAKAPATTEAPKKKKKKAQ